MPTSTCLLDDSVDLLLDAPCEEVCVVGLAGVFGQEHLADVRRTRQAAHVGCENAVCASLHLDSPLSSCSGSGVGPPPDPGAAGAVPQTAVVPVQAVPCSCITHIDGRHVSVERRETPFGQLVAAARTSAACGCATTPGRRWRASRTQIPGRPGRTRHGPRQVEQRGPLLGRVTASAKGLLQVLRHLRIRKSTSVGVMTSEEPGRSRRISAMRWRTLRV